ncbi:hypothetical protein IJZ97_01395, partial [bacterium]|nr:hypothetical protein [bacterium]
MTIIVNNIASSTNILPQLLSTNEIGNKRATQNTFIYNTLKTDSFERKSDKEKIITFNKLLNELNNDKNESNYAIVDKKKCTLTVYTQDGDVLKTYTVGLGSKRGDKLGYGSALGKKDPQYYEGQYTTSGEFTLDQVATS